MVDIVGKGVENLHKLVIVLIGLSDELTASVCDHTFFSGTETARCGKTRIFDSFLFSSTIQSLDKSVIRIVDAAR